MFKTILETIIEALFPLSKNEREALSLTKEEAYSTLPKARRCPIAFARSVFAYKDEKVSSIVWNIKYKKNAKAVSIGSYALFQELNRGFKGTKDKVLILPMPVTRKRRKERGYNQCELILDALQSLDERNIFDFSKTLLVRIHHDSRQTLKNRSERLISAKGIFSIDQTELRKMQIKNPDLLKHSVVVIDDVITTGSTMKEAMSVLKSAGFKNVYGYSLAH